MLFYFVFTLLIVKNFAQTGCQSIRLSGIGKTQKVSCNKPCCYLRFSGIRNNFQLDVACPGAVVELRYSGFTNRFTLNCKDCDEFGRFRSGLAAPANINKNVAVGTCAQPPTAKCGEKSYYPEYQLCCNGVIHRKEFRGSQVWNKCCGNKSYSPSTRICCNGSVRKGTEGSGYKCCGVFSYSPQNYQCCAGNNALISKRESCATAASLPPALERQCQELRESGIENKKTVTCTKACCYFRFSGIENQFTLNVACPGANVELRYSGFDNAFTMNGKDYHEFGPFRSSVAEPIHNRDVAIAGCTEPPTDKCGEKPYYPDLQLCCDGAINRKNFQGFPERSWDQCCGRGSIDTRRNLCCNGSVQRGSVAYGYKCCGYLSFHTKYYRCCEGNRVVPLSQTCAEAGPSPPNPPTPTPPIVHQPKWKGNSSGIRNTGVFTCDRPICDFNASGIENNWTINVICANARVDLSVSGIRNSLTINCSGCTVPKKPSGIDQKFTLNNSQEINGTCRKTLLQQEDQEFVSNINQNIVFGFGILLMSSGVILGVQRLRSNTDEEYEDLM